jgi:hypothetical protein
MQCSFATLSLSLLTLSIASPVPTTSEEKAAAKAAKGAASPTTIAASAATSTAASSNAGGVTAAAGGDVLTAYDYNTVQISGGTAGSAETEANALFANMDMNNLAGVSAADLDIVQGTYDAAEDAEVNAFNPAIEAATGDAATALQVSCS